MAWNESIITVKGVALAAELIDGGSMEITKAEAGESTTDSVALAFQKAIKSPIDVPVSIVKKDKTETGIALTVQIKNTGAARAYKMRQIGIYAKTESSEETLFAVFQSAEGDEIPSADEYPDFLMEFSANIAVSNADNITVVTEPATVIVTEEMLEAAMRDYAPTYTNVENLTELSSGEMLSTAFGKLAKAVKTLISHIADNVRHITAAERTAWNGKAAGDHTHSAASQSAAGLMSAADKTKLDGIATGANKYTHPTSAGNKHIPSGGSSGQILRWSADGTAAWGNDNNTTYSAATQSAAGLMSANDKKKLDGVAASANNYSLPAASSTARGGVKIGYAANGRNYPVQLSNEQMYVNVPWTDNNTTYSNMTAATASAAGKAGLVPAPAAGAQGKYLRGDGTWQTPPDTNTTYGAATQSANGLMSAADKTKLDGIATGANKYTHPTTAGNKHIPSGGSSGQILRWSADGTAAWGNDNNTTYSNMKGASASANGAAGLVPAPTKGNQAKYLRADGTWQTPPDTNTTYSAATQSAAGLMSANDKKKLDGVAASANNYSLPAASSTARGGVKIGYAANGRNYPVQLSNEKMYVNVPDNLVEILTGHVVTSTNATPTISNSEGSHILIKLRGRSSNNAVSGYGIDECWIRNYHSISGSTTVTLYNGTTYETNITVTPNGAVNLKCTKTLGTGYRIEYTLQYYR